MVWYRMWAAQGELRFPKEGAAGGGLFTTDSSLSNQLEVEGISRWWSWCPPKGMVATRIITMIPLFDCEHLGDKGLYVSLAVVFLPGPS